MGEGRAAVDERIDTVVVDVGRSEGVDLRDLRVRLLMHLPRIAGSEGGISNASLAAEARRIARADTVSGQWETSIEHPATTSLRDTVLEPMSDLTAHRVFGDRHFLRSWRADAEYFSLSTRGQRSILAACGIANFRWGRVREGLATTIGVDESEIVDLCRMFTFDRAPSNTASRMLSQVVRQLRRADRRQRLIVTVVDPNLGFTGASYRASGWSLVARAEHPPFAYVDEEYRTAGQLIEEYGSMDPTDLTRLLGCRYSLSSCPLHPSDIYAFALDSGLRHRLEQLTAAPLRVASMKPAVSP